MQVFENCLPTYCKAPHLSAKYSSKDCIIKTDVLTAIFTKVDLNGEYKQDERAQSCNLPRTYEKAASKSVWQDRHIIDWSGACILDEAFESQSYC